MLALLQQQAQAHADAVAYILPDRVITYRRFWSRIERACARLQGEWGVRPSDRVAYVGHGHPDALILYFALLRLGASLLPLETLTPAAARAALDHQPVSLVVHDDGMVWQGGSSQPLSLLLADWCHFDPECIEEAPASARLWLISPERIWQAWTMDQLLSAMAPQLTSVYVGSQIFSMPVLTDIILPTLHAARELHFSATTQVRASLGQPLRND